MPLSYKTSSFNFLKKSPLRHAAHMPHSGHIGAIDAGEKTGEEYRTKAQSALPSARRNVEADAPKEKRV